MKGFITREKLYAIWHKAVREFNRRNPNQNLKPIGYWENPGGLYVSKEVVLIFRDMLLKEFEYDEEQGNGH